MDDRVAPQAVIDAGQQHDKELLLPLRISVCGGQLMLDQNYWLADGTAGSNGDKVTDEALGCPSVPQYAYRQGVGVYLALNHVEFRELRELEKCLR